MPVVHEPFGFCNVAHLERFRNGPWSRTPSETCKAVRTEATTPRTYSPVLRGISVHVGFLESPKTLTPDALTYAPQYD